YTTRFRSDRSLFIQHRRPNPALAPGRLVAGSNLVPVDDVPPGGDVVGAPVLILEVISVLPHIEAEDGGIAVHHRRVLVGRAGDGELSVFGDDKPRPAAAEAGGCRLGEGFFKRLEAAEGLVDGGRELTRGLLGAAGLHDLPKERVVVMATPVVADGGADVFRYAVKVLEELLDALLGEVGMALQRGVEVVDVSSVVLIVMDPHRLLVDVGLQRVVIVGQRWQLVSHRTNSSLNEMFSREYQFLIGLKFPLRIFPPLV